MTKPTFGTAAFEATTDRWAIDALIEGGQLEWNTGGRLVTTPHGDETKLIFEVWADANGDVFWSQHVDDVDLGAEDGLTSVQQDEDGAL